MCLVLRMFLVAYVTIWTLYISLGMKENTILVHFNEDWMVETTERLQIFAAQ